MKNKKKIIFFISIFIFFIIPGASYGEYVFLKNGDIIECRIIKDSAASITIKKKDGKTQKIRRSKILRLVYTKVYMGKIYVQKTDGEGLQVYMVDEDQESYTFRKDITKPEEFTLKRSQVLFIARKNPTGLQGKPDFYEIELKWNPPYDPVRYYNIYTKVERKDIESDFKFVAKTSKREYTLENLKSNTEYYIHVKAVDKNEYESMPSNEIKVKTKNIPPKLPQNLSCSIIKDFGKKVDLKFAWNPSKDPDGEITDYLIHIKDKNSKFKKNIQISKTKHPDKTEFVFEKINDDTEYVFNITAVDDMGGKSPGSELDFNTANNLPDEPENITLTKKLDKSKKKMQVKLKWTAAKDSDGKVTAYRIYNKVGEGLKKVKELKGTEYSINNLNPASTHYFIIKSVDDRVGESQNNSFISTRDKLPLDLIISGNQYIPFGYFNSIVQNGLGVNLRVINWDMFFTDFGFGIEGAFMTFNGEKKSVDSANLIPLLVTINYKYNLIFDLFLGAKVGGGMSYNKVKYKSFNPKTDKIESTDRGAFQPVAAVGISLFYLIHKRLIIQLSSDFNMTFEGSNFINNLSFVAGIGYRFGL
jgi:hypothetical protein